MDWELDEVEHPSVEQLSAMAGDLYQPAKTGLASFAEVKQEGTLRRQLYALNKAGRVSGKKNSAGFTLRHCA